MKHNTHRVKKFMLAEQLLRCFIITLLIVSVITTISGVFYHLLTEKKDDWHLFCIFVMLAVYCLTTPTMLLISINQREHVEVDWKIQKATLIKSKRIHGFSFTKKGNFSVGIVGEDGTITRRIIKKDYAKAFPLINPTESPYINIYDGVYNKTETFWFSKRTIECHHVFYAIYV